MQDKNRDSLLNLEKYLFLFFLVALFLCSVSPVNAASFTGQYWNWGSGASPSDPTGSANLTRTDANINFEWGNGSPDASINVDHFYTRWTKTEILAGGNYTFTATVDDGVRVYVDSTLVINSWIDQGTTTYTASADIAAGSHTIKVEFYENGGGAVCQFSYDSPPSVSTLSPVASTTGVSPSANLVLTFDQNVTAVAGKNVTIKKYSDDSTIETISANDTSKVTVSGATATINPATTLSDLTGYYVLIDSGAFKDSSNKIYTGISVKTSWSFTTADTTPPTVGSFSPVNTATAVSSTTNLVLTLSENIVAVSGKNITLKKSSDDSTVETIAANNTDKVTIDGSAITINPSAVLDNVTGYYVVIDSGAFKDTADNNFAGISAKTAWSFTTADTIVPTVSSLSPTTSASNVSSSANLVITFSENVSAVADKKIYVKKTADDSDIEDISANDEDNVSISNAVVTINPTVVFDDQTQYYVLIDSGAFEDLSGNDFAGISNNSDWTFTTADTTAPVVTSFSPVNGAEGVSLDQNLAITFSESVVIGSGDLKIYKVSGDSLVETISVGSSKVTGSGTNTILLNPGNDFQYGTAYYIQIDGDTFADSSDNKFTGITDKAIWRFTTKSAPATSSSSSTNGGGKSSLPSPVQVAVVSGKEVNNNKQSQSPKIFVKPSEKFVLRLKAPDADQVKNVFVKLNKKSYKMTLDKTDPRNMIFTATINLGEAGTYPYTVETNYGSMVVRSKGTVFVQELMEKEKKAASPEPVLGIRNPATSSQPISALGTQIIPSLGPTSAGFISPQKINNVSPEPSPIAQPVPVPGPQEEKGQEISLFNKMFGTLGGGASHLAKSVTNSFSIPARTLTSLFERAPEHVYRKVTVKLASADGTPLAGAKVTISSKPQTGMTNNQGSVEFHNIEAGSHKLRVDYKGYSSRQSLEITEAVTEVTINITANFKKSWSLF